MHVKYTLTACVDCIAYIDSGEVPEERPTLPDEIRALLGSDEDVANLVSASGRSEDGDGLCDPDHVDFYAASDDWFSSSPCECCGSTLAGDRNWIAVLAAD
jgi:hypothetical protein